MLVAIEVLHHCVCQFDLVTYEKGEQPLNRIKLGVEWHRIKVERQLNNTGITVTCHRVPQYGVIIVFN